MNAYAWLTCLKKGCAKVWSKEYYLVEQGSCKLKADKKKKSATETVYIAEVGFFNTPNPYLLPLTDSFNFNFSFLILPDVISNNIPVLFL